MLLFSPYSFPERGALPSGWHVFPEEIHTPKYTALMATTAKRSHLTKRESDDNLKPEIHSRTTPSRKSYWDRRCTQEGARLPLVASAPRARPTALPRLRVSQATNRSSLHTKIVSNWKHLDWLTIIPRAIAPFPSFLGTLSRIVDR